MKNILRMLPLLLLVLNACSPEEIVPSGKTTSVAHPFYSDYFDIQVSDGIQYTITPSDSDKVVLETDDNVQAEINVEQIGNIIYVNHKKGSSVDWNKTRVKAHFYTSQTLATIQGSNGSNGSCDYTLYNPSGNLKIVLSGGSSFISAIEMPSGSLWVELSDGSAANLNGNVNDMRLLSESGSQLNAYNLTTKNLVLQIFSGCSIAYVTVTDKIYVVEATGASQLYYKGAAIVNPNSVFLEGSAATPMN